MESSQPRVEEVASNNIVEKELQPPNPLKHKKKKVPFAVWLEQQELKISAKNIEQQDASLVFENESIAKDLETVDQKGDRSTPESGSNEKNQVPIKTCSEEHVPIDEEISAGNNEKQNDSLVSEEESIAGVQETIDIAEKEQPSMSKEQPPTTRRNKKKRIPFQIWLETHAPADQRISAESTGAEDASLDTKQESISVLQETPEKEQSFKSGVENVKKQDTSLPEEEGGQENSLKKEICREEPVISTTELVTEKKNISKSQKKVDQKEDKQTSKTKRIKKTPLLWKSFPEPDAVIDLAFFSENSDVNNGPVKENQSFQAALPISRKKTIWKMLPKSVPRIDISFIAENIETPNVSMPAQERDEAAFLKKDKIQTENLTEVPHNQTAENVQGESLNKIQNLPHSSEKTSQAKCTCLAKFKETELRFKEVEKYLMKQLDEMFDTNKKLNARLRQEKDMMRKVLSERRQSKKLMVSAQIQTDSQESPKQKAANYQSVSMQTEMDLQETSCPLKPVLQTISTQTEMDMLETSYPPKPVCQTISTQTEMDMLETSYPPKPVCQTISTQTEMDMLETNYPPKPVCQTISTQTEIDVLESRCQDHQDEKKPLKKYKRKNKRKSAMKAACELETLNNENSDLEEVPIVGTDGNQMASIKNYIHMIETEIATIEQIIEEETVSEIQHNGDQQDEKKPPKKYKCKNKRKAAIKADCELETLKNENLYGEKTEHEVVSTLERVEDQTASVKTEIHTEETVIAKVQQTTEEETVCETQQNGDQKERKPPKKYKRKNKRKVEMKVASELENLNNDKVSVENTEQEEVSIPETVGDQTGTIIIEIHKNETVIGKRQPATEDQMVPEIQQNGDQPDEKRPLTKSKCKKKKAKKAKLETVLNPKETDQNLIRNTDTPKTDLEIIPEIPQAASEQTETKHCKVSVDVTGRVPVVSTEGESGLMKKQRTSPQQVKVTLNKDVIKTTPEESETQAAKESAEQNNVCEPEESPMKKISLWRRIKKALTPSCLRQFKGRSEVHPA